MWVILTRDTKVLETSRQCMVAPASKAVLLLLSICAFFKQNYQRRKPGTRSPRCDLINAVGMDATLLPGELAAIVGELSAIVGFASALP